MLDAGGKQNENVASGVGTVTQGEGEQVIVTQTPEVGPHRPTFSNVGFDLCRRHLADLCEQPTALLAETHEVPVGDKPMRQPQWSSMRRYAMSSARAVDPIGQERSPGHEGVNGHCAQLSSNLGKQPIGPSPVETDTKLSIPAQRDNLGHSQSVEHVLELVRLFVHLALIAWTAPR